MAEMQYSVLHYQYKINKLPCFTFVELIVPKPTFKPDAHNQ